MVNTVTNEIIDTDKIIKEIGEFGRFQILNVFLICLGIMFWGASSVSYIFTAGNLNYRCEVTECEHHPPLFNENWVSEAIPQENGRLSRCSHFQIVGNLTNVTNCSGENFDESVKKTCNSFIYETFEKTIVNDFNLNCPENDWKRTLIGTISYIAQFTCILFIGYFSDRYGRLTAFICAITISSVFGVIKSFSVNYIMYCVMEFLCAASGTGIFSAGIILVVEIIGPGKRLINSVVGAIAYAIGTTLIGVTSMLTQNYRITLRIIHIPPFLFISYIWFVPESIRWLIAKKYGKLAKKNIMKIAKFNRIKLSSETLELLDRMSEWSKQSETLERVAETRSTRYTFKDITKSRYLLISLVICWFCWFTAAFVYYGLSLNSVSLNGDKYINFILICLTEIPGQILALLIIDRIGRRWTLFIGFLVCGLTCISSQIIPTNLTVLTLILLLIGKAFISMIYTTLSMLGTELFPTTLRHTLLTTCSAFGRLGSISATQTPLLLNYMQMLPFILFGICAIIAAFLSLFFAETMKTRLPDTIEDAESHKRRK